MVDEYFDDDDDVNRIIGLYEDGGADILTDEELSQIQVEKPLTDPNDFNTNLALHLTESELGKIAQDVIQWVDWDEESRTDWKTREAKGIRMMGVSENIEGGAKFDGASKVVHPLLVEGCVQFQARSIAELWPAGGPAKTAIIGKVTQERQAQSERVRDYINYQYTSDMPGAFEEEDSLLFRLPLSGSCFIKVYSDPILKKRVRRFIDPNDFVVPYTATDLMSAPRYTHILRESKNIVKKKMVSGFYRKVDLTDPAEESEQSSGTQEVRTEIDAAEGRSPTSYDDDQRHTNYEMHVDYDLPGFEDNDGIALPYIITVNKDDQKTLSIYRNYKKTDPLRLKRMYFVHRKFLPGFGFYGFGFIHVIGGLSSAATGSLRALLDAAHFANMPAGYRAKGTNLPDGDEPLAPGEFRETETHIDDLNKAFFKLPFEEPSMTLYNLLGYLSEIGQRFILSIEKLVGESSANAPVGTTLALIEQGVKLSSAIHKRQHEAFKQEFAILSELNAESLEEKYPYEVEGDERVIYKKDFDSRVDVIPVSDPNIVTSVQRIAQGQALIQLATQNPDLYNRRACHERILKAMQIPDTEEILMDPGQVPHMGPVEENMAMMRMMPVKAFIDQDQYAHITVHESWFAALDGETQQRAGAAHIAHKAEHLALAYMIQIQGMLGPDIPIGQPLPPELENRVAQLAAQAVQLTPPPQNPDLAQIQSEQARKDAVVIADIERKDIAATSDIERKDALAEAEIIREHGLAQADIDRKGVATESDMMRRDVTV